MSLSCPTLKLLRWCKNQSLLSCNTYVSHPTLQHEKTLLTKTYESLCVCALECFRACVCERFICLQVRSCARMRIQYGLFKPTCSVNCSKRKPKTYFRLQPPSFYAFSFARQFCFVSNNNKKIQSNLDICLQVTNLGNSKNTNREFLRRQALESSNARYYEDVQ